MGLKTSDGPIFSKLISKDPNAHPGAVFTINKNTILDHYACVT